MVNSSKNKTLGLSEAEADEARKKYGSNTFARGKSKSFLRCFLENLGDPVIKILLAALIVNLFISLRGGDIIETVGIGISVFLATLISTLSERGSEAAFRRLEAECSHSSFRVWRDGQLREIPIEEIVVGDIVRISAGEQIPADAFIISGSLRVNQAMLTGESTEIEKICSKDKTKTPSSKSALFRGSTIISGEAELEVFSVGESSFLGRISDEIKLDTRESPLKIRLTKLASQISRLGYIAAILIALTYLFNTIVIDSGFVLPIIISKLQNFHYLFEHLLHAFMLGLTVIVMAVPEGLPMMIAVVLSSNIRRMIKDNILVRKPAGIEAAGSMNILFTDKTGTLTEGKMSVSRILCAESKQFENIEDFKKASPHVYELYLLNALFNTSASFIEGKVMGGNSTEEALGASVLKDTTRELLKSVSVNEKLQFDSAIKLSAASLGAPHHICLLKGAPEKLLPLCKSAYRQDGSRVPFSSVSYGILTKISELSREGERIILIAASDEMPTSSRIPSLAFICAAVLTDKPRKEARGSAASLAAAGIQVVMITGDNKDTAESIARQCGILNSARQRVITSDELSRLDDDQLKRILPSLAVLARALPTDKSRLVRVSQELGLVVGMTGDGINDAPALKRSDIGFSMGSGTSVAKEAGDIIITDNNLSSIVKAVLYGRTIFKSIRKFITLQLTMNFCAVGISMVGPFIGYDAPVTVVQMLWINIIMDTLGGLAFAGEAPRRSYLNEKPKKRDERILNKYMISQIVCSGLFTVGLYIFFLLSPWVAAHYRTAPGKIYLLSAFFALFIFTSVIHCFNSRTDRLNLFSDLTKNKAFIAIMMLVSSIQIFFIYLGGSVLRTAPLDFQELLFTLGLSLCVIPVDITRKLFLRIIGKKRGF